MKQLSLAEVVSRWSTLFSLPSLVERWRNGHASDIEREAAETVIAGWRERLSDLSWFMKCMNEHLARRANAEDHCTGRFWEGRFRSQALLDEAGLLTAMAYVDLNPVRAGIAAAPEASDFTSIQARIRERADAQCMPPAQATRLAPPLRPFGKTLPCTLADYLQLVDWTGRSIRDDKRGHIDERLPPILQRLNIEGDIWTVAMRPKGNVFGRAMGRLDHLRLHAATLGQSWVRGLRQAQRMYAG